MSGNPHCAAHDRSSAIFFLARINTTLMSSSGQSGFDLTNTKIIVEGAESNLIFSNLVVHQAIADVNSFSFIWREPAGKPSMNTYLAFYQKYLSKNVTIKIGNSISVKGLITSINCVQGDELGVHYEV